MSKIIQKKQIQGEICELLLWSQRQSKTKESSFTSTHQPNLFHSNDGSSPPERSRVVMHSLRLPHTESVCCIFPHKPSQTAPFGESSYPAGQEHRVPQASSTHTWLQPPLFIEQIRPAGSEIRLRITDMQAPEAKHGSRNATGSISGLPQVMGSSLPSEQWICPSHLLSADRQVPSGQRTSSSPQGPARGETCTQTPVSVGFILHIVTSEFVFYRVGRLCWSAVILIYFKSFALLIKVKGKII